jgi:hypothetical protein
VNKEGGLMKKKELNNRGKEMNTKKGINTEGRR